MSSKRIYVAALLLALILPILAACGGGDGGATGSPAASTGGTTASPAASTGGTTASPAASDAAASPAASEAAASEAAASDAAASPAGSTAAGGTGTTLDWSALQVEEGATLRFAAAGNTTEQQIYLQGIERFQQQFPNAKITFEAVPAEYETTITSAFSGGTAPDIFILNGELMGALAPNGLLLPLDEAMQATGRQASDFYEPLVELYQQEGQTYGLPKDFNPLVLFINTQLAQQAGVDPASIQTWPQLQEAAQKMTSGEGAGKVFGLCINPDIQRMGAQMFQNGNPIIENNQAVFGNESGVAAVQFWKSFVDAGTGATFQDMGAGWCGEAFARQTAAMAVEGGWLVPFMADPQQGGQDVQYTAIPLPIPEGGEQATWLFTNAIAANAQTRFPQAAAAAVLFLTSEANQEPQIETGLAQPSLKSLAEAPYYETNEVAQVLVQAGENGRVADSVLGGPRKKADVIRIINQSGLERIFIGGEDVQATLEAAAQEVNGVLQQ